jgi:prevent-host-death family protein
MTYSISMNMGHKEPGMTKQYSITEAKNQLSSLVHEVERGVRVELTRRGKAVAVILSKGDDSRPQTGGSGFWEALREFRRKVPLKDLDLNPDRIWGGVRYRSADRDIGL